MAAIGGRPSAERACRAVRAVPCRAPGGRAGRKSRVAMRCVPLLCVAVSRSLQCSAVQYNNLAGVVSARQHASPLWLLVLAGRGPARGSERMSGELTARRVSARLRKLPARRVSIPTFRPVLRPRAASRPPEATSATSPCLAMPCLAGRTGPHVSLRTVYCAHVRAGAAGSRPAGQEGGRREEQGCKGAARARQIPGRTCTHRWRASIAAGAGVRGCGCAGAGRLAGHASTARFQHGMHLPHCTACTPGTAGQQMGTSAVEAGASVVAAVAVA